MVWVALLWYYSGFMTYSAAILLNRELNGNSITTTEFAWGFLASLFGPICIIFFFFGLFNPDEVIFKQRDK